MRSTFNLLLYGWLGAEQIWNGANFGILKSNHNSRYVENNDYWYPDGSRPLAEPDVGLNNVNEQVYTIHNTFLQYLQETQHTPSGDEELKIKSREISNVLKYSFLSVTVPT